MQMFKWADVNSFSPCCGLCNGCNGIRAKKLRKTIYPDLHKFINGEWRKRTTEDYISASGKDGKNEHFVLLQNKTLHVNAW